MLNLKKDLCILMLRVLCFVVLICSAYGQTCATAPIVNLDTVTSQPYVFSLDIDASTPQGSFSFCTSSVDSGAGGSFISAARNLRINTGNNPYRLTIDSCSSMLDSGFQVLSSANNDCSLLYCFQGLVDLEPGTCPGGNTGGRRIASFPLGKNQQYLLLLYGTRYYGGTGYGSAQVSLTFSSIPSPVNDACVDAIAIAPRAYIAGTTSGAGWENIYSSLTGCNFYSQFSKFSPSVWYSFNSGNSPAALLYSCGGYPLTFVSVVYLSTGGCDGSDTTCVSNVIYNGDCGDGTGMGSLYYPTLAPNTDYLINVNGAVEALGDFFFFLHLADANAQCSAAQPITTLPFSFSGSADAAPSNTGCASNTNAVYFSINTGYGIYDLTLDTCSSNFDTVISFKTSCFIDTTACINEADNGCASGSGSMLSNIIDLPTATQYFIRVASKTRALNSTYTLSVSGRYVDSNGACSRPMTISSLPFTFTGSTRGTDSVTVCGGPSSPASWFSFNTGGGFASLRFTGSGSGYQALIRVVSACGGNCVASGTGSISMNEVPANQQWLIAVTGGTGDYSFSVSAVEYQAPAIICPADLVVTASTSTCKYSGSTGTPTVVSLDGGTSSYSKSPKAPYSIGRDIEVRYTAVNSRRPSLSSWCVQRLTVLRPENSQC